MTLTPLPFSDDFLRTLPAAGDGIGDRRRRAAKLLEETPWPTAEAEEWRYSPIGKIDPAAFAPAGGPGSTAASSLADGLDASARVSFVDGFVVGSTSDILPASADELGDLPDGAVSLLAAALAPQPMVVRIPDGAVVDEPIVVSFTVASAGASFPHLVVDAGADSQATVVVVHESADVEALAVPRVEIRSASAARLTLVELQRLGPGVTSLGRTAASVGSQSTLTGWTAGLGGGYARHRLDCALAGRGAAVDYAGVYFGSGTQALDYRVFVDHVERDTTSNLRFNGVVDDHSTAIYTGMIRIHPTAGGSNAVQANRNITLSPDAWAESVPNLEIENNDVHCAHASTVGPVDEDQLFYLESRGVPTGVARRLIVAGFFADIVAQAPIAAIGDATTAEIGRRLNERESS